jgi:RNA polymerase sigma factor (sigma-70 family)
VGISESGIEGAREFPSTSWSVMVHARDPSSPDYAHHLARLVELYWRPVYSVIRQGWSRAHDEAKDLTQEFFATVVLDRELLRSYSPERGSFRALLRTAIKHFMHDLARVAGARKRGGGAAVASLDHIGAESVAVVPGAEGMTPEQIFDLAWTQSVMSQATTRLQEQLAADGKATAFEAFRRYDLEGGSDTDTYAELGRSLGLSEQQVRHALMHARAAFRETVTDVVRGYVDDPADLAAELDSLFGG